MPPVQKPHSPLLGVIPWPASWPNGPFRRTVATVLGALLTWTALTGVYANLTGTAPPTSPTIINVSGDNNNVIARSPTGYDCLRDWTVTGGRDPATSQVIHVCTSPDKRYVITSREGGSPVAFDTVAGQFLDVEAVERLYK